MDNICYNCKHCYIAGLGIGSPDWRCGKHDDEKVESYDTCRDFESDNTDTDDDTDKID